VPSPPHSAERDVPLRDKMLKQPDGNNRFSRKPDGFVSIVGEVYIQLILYQCIIIEWYSRGFVFMCGLYYTLFVESWAYLDAVFIEELHLYGNSVNCQLSVRLRMSECIPSNWC